MKILAVSDKKSPFLWDNYTKEKVRDYDCIISCGDLSSEYLSLLVTYAKGPLFCVPGNHDDYSIKPPEGCINIDGKIETFKGVRIMGLGGSVRYKDGPNQYTERQMKMRYMRLLPSIMLKGGVDILVTHSPAKGLGDDPASRAHIGFQTLNTIIDKYKPTLHFHGHMHLNYGASIPRIIEYNDTKIINAYEKYEIEIDEL